MESLDLRVLTDALAWRKGGHGVILVTVVETWGSAPRPLGAMLAVRDDGVVSGSVSGGCVEDDLIARIKSGEHTGDKPSMIAYGVTKDEAARFGLPCGGTLRLVQEPLLETAWVSELLERTANHELVARTLVLSSGQVALKAAERGDAMVFDGLTLMTLFGPNWRLLLIGAGQLSQAVAPTATMLAFDVLVCDPRDEYAKALRMENVTRMQGMPDDVIREMGVDAHTAIVALTHDSKLDDMALMQALKSDAFYVGALGSRSNQAKRKTRLIEHFDMLDSDFAKLHGPVGLSLGAKTPAEIAVSIVAEMIQVRHSALKSVASQVASSCPIA